MIRLSRRNHELVVVSLGSIAYVEANPDTLITLATGERLHARESIDELIEAARAWQRDVFSVAAVGAGVREAR